MYGLSGKPSVSFDSTSFDSTGNTLYFSHKSVATFAACKSYFATMLAEKLSHAYSALPATGSADDPGRLCSSEASAAP